MSLVFPMGEGFVVADGTLVRSLLNPLDQNSGLKAGVFEEFSIAVGDLEPGQWSKIQVHPVVALVTIVLTGTLQVTIKDPHGGEPTTTLVAPISAVLVERGAFLQLHNPGEEPCRVLYVVGPPYIVQLDGDGTVVYEDSVSLRQTWEELAALDWSPPELPDTERMLAARHEAEGAVRVTADRPRQ